MDDDRELSEIISDVQQHGRAAANSMRELVRAVLMSGAGAAGLAVDETKALLDKLAERGQIAERGARDILDDLSRRSRKQARQKRAVAERQVTDSMKRLGVSSKTDVAELDGKIGLLAEKVDQLLAAWTESRPAPPRM